MAIEELITRRLEKSINDKVFPGAVVGIVYQTGERKILPSGHFTYETGSPEITQNTVYDVASLTKSLAGAAALLKLTDEQKISLDEKIYTYVPGFDNYENKKEVSIWNLLTYTLDLGIPSLATLKHKTAHDIADLIVQAPLQNIPGGRFQYVNSTAFFIHIIVKKVSGMGLDTFCQEKFYIPLAMRHTFWKPAEAERKHIPPTEIDVWRGRTVQGEVHDESTHVLQQEYDALAIAGLFSNVPDILTFQEMLLGGGEKDTQRYFSERTTALMHTDQLPQGPDHPALGWVMNEPSFMGNATSTQAFAKTGFTGCLMITDPVKKIGLVMLSNATYPIRPQSRDPLNQVRRDIADIVFS